TAGGLRRVERVQLGVVVARQRPLDKLLLLCRKGHGTRDCRCIRDDSQDGGVGHGNKLDKVGEAAIRVRTVVGAQQVDYGVNGSVVRHQSSSPNLAIILW